MKSNCHNRIDLCITVILLLLGLCLVCGGARAVEVRTLESGGRTVSFEILVPEPEIAPGPEGRAGIRLPGYGSFSPPGAVELPGKTFLVAVPPQGAVRVTFSALEREGLGEITLRRVPGERFVRGENDIPYTEYYYPPDPWAETGPPPLVSPGTASFMGRQRVLPIRVNPVRTGEGGISIVRRLSVTVSFDQGAGRDSGLEGLAPEPGGAGAWDRLYRGLLVNPDDVSRFRKPLAPRRDMLRGQEPARRLKIRIPETGFYSIRADSLIDSGLLSEYLPTDYFALKKYYFDSNEADLVREVDIPFVVMEGSSPNTGVFDADDHLVFYALGIRDDAQAGDVDASFTDDNIVWLEEEVPGALMTERPPLPTEGGIQPSPSLSTVYGREDTYYHKNARPGSSDYNFMTGYVEAEAALPFQAHGCAGGRTFSVTVRVTGSQSSISNQHLEFFIRNGSTGEHLIGQRTISYKNDYTFDFASLSSDWLEDGENELVIRTDKAYGFLVNDFAVSYPRLFTSFGDVLEFSIMGSPLINRRTITITNFTVDSGILIDMTDPGSPRYIELPSDHFTADGGTFTCTFNLETESDGRYAVIGAGGGGLIPAGTISIDDPSHIREEGGPYDALIVSHADFVDSMRVYADWRHGKDGYRILTVDVADVYDEFNGGLPSYNAIKRCIRYGFERWGVEYVILAGDAQEDRKQLFEKSPPDYVPTYTYAVGVISSDYEDEVVASDRWYAFLDYPASDNFPDVFIGRFPVGNDIELRAIRAKLMSFEEASTGDTWRRNIVLFADDSWSGRAVYYQYKYYEGEFEWSMDDVGSGIEEALPGGFDLRRCFLSRWTDGAHDNLSESGAAVYSRANDSTRTYFTPYLVRRLNEGCLFFSFQGHANRSTLTTEAGFAAFRQYSDIDSLDANNRYNIFVGMACHISEFAKASELSREAYDGPNGDCFAEQILFKPGKASVASYASTGYEYLDENAIFSERLHKIFFQSPPVDSVPPANEYTGAHWVLGEAITMAEIDHIGKSSYGYRQVLRYLLLGDPMMKVDTGPPLMALEADWGDGWETVPPDSFRARSGTNDCRVRLSVSDVVAVGPVSCFVDEEDWTDSLEVTRLADEDLTYARSYRAEFDYTMNLDDGALHFSVISPGGAEIGTLDVPFSTTIRLFYNDNLEITPLVESPPTGTFRLTAAFPAYPDQAPVLLLDGLEMDGVTFAASDPDNPLDWVAVFDYTFASGSRVLTVKIGEFGKDFLFNVTGNELVLDAFAFPNPFSEGTNIVFTLNLPVESGNIDIYNVSGVRVRKLKLGPADFDAANYPRPHSVYWDGRDTAGDLVANGTYIYLLNVSRGGSDLSITGKCVRLK